MYLEEAHVYSTENTSPIIYLKALLQGRTVKIGDYEYCLCETQNDGCQLVMVLPDNQILGADMSISDFIMWTMKNEDETFIVEANNVLNDIK